MKDNFRQASGTNYSGPRPVKGGIYTVTNVTIRDDKVALKFAEFNSRLWFHATGFKPAVREQFDFRNHVREKEPA